jgi:hypothetical protein
MLSDPHPASLTFGAYEHLTLDGFVDIIIN